MYVIIVGCGRVGSALAMLLSQEGHEVTVIDINPAQFERFLGEDFTGNTIVGDGIDIDVLRQAEIERADAFVTATSGDNHNLMAAQIAQRIFKVPRVVARCNDPIRGTIYEKLGLRMVIPTTIGAQYLHRAIMEEPAPAEPQVTGDSQPPAGVDG
jgi:trk system potassium uptake protein TrkA